MKRQHWTAALLAALVVFSMVLSGCGKPKATATVAPTKVVVKTPTSAPTPVPTKVVVETPTSVPTPVPTKAPTATPVPTPAKPGTLNLDWGREPQVDPSLASDPASVNVVSNLFMSLTRLHPKSGIAMPFLANKWEVSKDGLTWTFYLRNDVKWVHYNPKTGKANVVKDYSGKERVVTAGDVVYGVQRSIDPLTKSPYAINLYVIKNAEAVNKGESGLTLNDVGVKAVNTFTVQFTLEKPVPSFPAVVALPATMPQPQWALNAWSDNWTEPGLIETNGPYMLSKWMHGFELDMIKNPYWVHAKAVQIKDVHGAIINTPDTALAMYKDNQLDLLSLSSADAVRVKAMADLAKTYHKAPAKSALSKEVAAYASLFPYAHDMLVKSWVKGTFPVLGGYNIFEWTVDVSKKPASD